MAGQVRVVLVHGSQLSAAQWTRYATLLGPDVDLAVPDLPAHGTRRDEAFTWERALEVARLAEALVELDDRPEREFAVQFEEASLVTLGFMSEVPFLMTEYFRAVRTRPDRAIIRDDWIRP